MTACGERDGEKATRLAWEIEELRQKTSYCSHMEFIGKLTDEDKVNCPKYKEEWKRKNDELNELAKKGVAPDYNKLMQKAIVEDAKKKK